MTLRKISADSFNLLCSSSTNEIGSIASNSAVCDCWVVTPNANAAAAVLVASTVDVSAHYREAVNR